MNKIKLIMLVLTLIFKPTFAQKKKNVVLPPLQDIPSLKIFTMSELDTTDLSKVYRLKIKSTDKDLSKLAECESLMTLSISNHTLKAFPKEIAACKNLVSLKFESYFVEELPVILKDLKQLRYLDLSNQRWRLHDVFDILKDLPNLEYLALNFFPADLIFSSKLNQLKNLKELTLKHLKVEEIEQNAFKISQLKAINISFCSQIKVNDWINEIVKLDQLQTLILNYNKLKRLPSALEVMQNLKKIQFTEALKDTEFETRELYDEHIKEMRKKLHQANFILGLYVSEYKFLEP